MDDDDVRDHVIATVEPVDRWVLGVMQHRIHDEDDPVFLDEPLHGCEPAQVRPPTAQRLDLLEVRRVVTKILERLPLRMSSQHSTR